MSSGPRYSVVYEKDDTTVEVFFSTRGGAEEWKRWLNKSQPELDPQVRER